MGIKYTSLTKKAMMICFETHKNQKDKSGMPYVFHPFHLAEHSDCTIEDLKKEGFSADTIEALRLLTHEKSVPYMDYIAALKGNPIARKVKLADLAHNSDIGRLAIVTDKDLKRLEKYQKARNLLLEE